MPGIRDNLTRIRDDLRSGGLMHSLYLDERISKLYDVITLPGVRRPKMLGFRIDEIKHTLTLEGEAGLWRTLGTSGNVVS